MTGRLATLKYPVTRTTSHAPHHAAGLANIVDAIDRWDLVTIDPFVGPLLGGLGEWTVRYDRQQPADAIIVDWAHLTLTVPRNSRTLDTAVELVSDLDGSRWLRRLVLRTVTDLGLDVDEFLRPA